MPYVVVGSYQGHALCGKKQSTCRISVEAVECNGVA